MLEPKEGLLTFSAEGNNTPGSIYYSRRRHWPGNISDCGNSASGITIGRGLDLGSRSKDESYSKLLRAGIPSEQAKKIAEGATLTHCQTNEFVKANRKSLEKLPRFSSWNYLE